MESSGLSGVNFRNLESDLYYLKENVATHFADTPLKVAKEILERKILFKDELKQYKNDFYLEYKKLIKEMRIAKLPYRAIDTIKNSWKEGKLLPNSLNSKIPDKWREKNLSKEIRKTYLSEIQKKFIDQAIALEAESSLAEKIYWLHGTNSSSLSLLSQTDYSLEPTGVLLDKGLAPMCGEIFRGGMVQHGINQNRISADTIRNIELCWHYASNVSNSFEANLFEDCEVLFLNFLENIFHPLIGENDSNLVRMFQFKQWKPVEFINLCEKHKGEIQDFRDKIWLRSSPNEAKLLRALAISNKNIGREMNVKERSRMWQDMFPGDLEFFTEEYDISWLDGDYDRILSLNFFKSNSLRTQIEAILYIKYHGKKGLETVYDNDENSYTWENIVRQFGKNVTVEEILDSLKKRIDARIKYRNKHLAKRILRLEQLFDTQPKINFSENDRLQITKPFPILMASTKLPAICVRVDSECNLRKAQLGTDIDLLFVEEPNIPTMQQWLDSQLLLPGKVHVLSSEILKSIKTLPCIHAPYQVVENHSYLTSSKQSKLNQDLKAYVNFLYTQPYPKAGERVHHGIVHSLRAMIFSQVIAELYLRAGKKINCKPGDLQIATALHDCARQNDGIDLWDKESGEACKTILIEKFERTLEEAQHLAFCISEKDSPNPTSIEQKIIHDSDCIEILRCLYSENDFREDELWIRRELDSQIVSEFISEAKHFIALTELPIIKKFITQSEEPYHCLIQILCYVPIFDVIESSISTARGEFTRSDNYLLSPEVKKLLQSSL